MLKLVNNRIVFLDLLRAFAVIAMIQGHTLDILLQQSYREGSFAHYLWNFNRGLTAPLFLFTAGCVFTFVYMNTNSVFRDNPRVKKGLLRGLVLIIIGYLIKFPTAGFLSFTGVSEKSWQIFYAIDVIQLIGVGLIALILLFYIWEKSGVEFNRLIIISIGVLLLLTVLCEYVDWYTYLHPFPAGYLYMGEGAKFPLLPNLVYILTGAVLGRFIALKQKRVNSRKLRINLALYGFLFIVVYEVLNIIHNFYGNPLNLISKTTNMVFIRTGMVLIIVLLIMELSSRIKKLPKIVEITGTYTLLIYVVHLFILYGSAWNKGIYHYYAGSFTFTFSVLSAAGMVILMVLLAYAAYLAEEWKKKILRK